MDENESQPQPSRFLRINAVSRRVGLSRATIYRRVKAGKFPAPIRDGSPDVSSVISWWVESEIDAWMAERINAPRPSQTGARHR